MKLENMKVRQRVTIEAEIVELRSDGIVVVEVRVSREYEKKFPGLRATEFGISYDIPLSSETMKGWKP